VGDVLTVLGGRLRVSECGGPLVLSPEPPEKPCCCCPKPPSSCCVGISKSGAGPPDGELSLSGKYYVLLNCSGGFEKETLDCTQGFPECLTKDYDVSGYVRAGGQIDDFGEVEGQKFDNHVDCGPGKIPKITTILEDSAEFDLSFEELECPESNDKLYCIPISWSATSSNCGAPTSIAVTVCLKFTPKD
jgi:hypothetical protein